MNEQLQTIITQAWDQRDHLTESQRTETYQAVQTLYRLLRQGEVRVAEPQGNHQWQTHVWIKQAILLSFRLFENQPIIYGGTTAYDKIPLQFKDWQEPQWHDKQCRLVPGAVVRDGAHIAPGVILMPSFVNVGAYVDANTMIDSWVTVGSCAQIGKSCHISEGVGVGGVLEPLQSNPVIIEDNCFIGARSAIVEGVVVETGSVISMGVFIGASTKIVDRTTSEIFYGRVPAYSVVVPGTLPPESGQGPHLAAAIIIKRVDEKTRNKTSLNELLRP